MEREDKIDWTKELENIMNSDAADSYFKARETDKKAKVQTGGGDNDGASTACGSDVPDLEEVE